MPRLIPTLNPTQLVDDDLAWALGRGVRAVRINLGRNSLDVNLALAVRVEQVAATAREPVRIFFDLPGPKARLGGLERPVDLEAGQPLVLGAGGAPVTTAWLFDQVAPGDHLALGRRGARARIAAVAPDRLDLVGVEGGSIRSFDSVFIEGRLARFADGLTPDDRRLAAGLLARVTSPTIAPSFVESPETALALRRLARELGAAPPRIVAKIETSAGVAHAEAIAAAADGLLIGRDDLSREVPIDRIDAHVLRWAAELGGEREIVAASGYFADLAGAGRLSPDASARLHQLAASRIHALVSDETAFLPGAFRAIIQTGLDHGFR